MFERRVEIFPAFELSVVVERARSSPPGTFPLFDLCDPVRLPLQRPPAPFGCSSDSDDDSDDESDCAPRYLGAIFDQREPSASRHTAPNRTLPTLWNCISPQHQRFSQRALSKWHQCRNRGGRARVLSITRRFRAGHHHYRGSPANPARRITCRGSVAHEQPSDEHRRHNCATAIYHFVLRLVRFHVSSQH